MTTYNSYFGVLRTGSKSGPGVGGAIKPWATPLISTSSGGAGTVPVSAGSQLGCGVAGIAYSETLTAQGGTTPYTWSVTSGSLPPGLSLGSSTGMISGTPTTAGNFSFTVKVQDANGNYSTQAYAIAIGSLSTGNGVFGFVG